VVRKTTLKEAFEEKVVGNCKRIINLRVWEGSMLALW
jgi:hypothetical protein